MTGKPLLHASHIQPARASVTGPRRQRGQARTLERIVVSVTNPLPRTPPMVDRVRPCWRRRGGGSIRGAGARHPFVVRRESGRSTNTRVSLMNSPNPYAPPQAKVVDVVEDSDDFELAGAGVRFGAYIIDSMLSMLVVALFFVALYMSLDNKPGAGIVWLMTVVSAGVLIWLNVLYVVQNGQSIAKKWLGIKVVRSDGSPASL